MYDILWLKEGSQPNTSCIFISLQRVGSNHQKHQESEQILKGFFLNSVEIAHQLRRQEVRQVTILKVLPWPWEWRLLLYPTVSPVLLILFHKRVQQKWVLISKRELKFVVQLWPQRSAIFLKNVSIWTTLRLYKIIPVSQKTCLVRLLLINQL